MLYFSPGVTKLRPAELFFRAHCMKLNAMVCSNTEMNIKISVAVHKKCTNDFIFSISDYNFSQCITKKSANDSLQ